jgi:hypothetical protein
MAHHGKPRRPTVLLGFVDEYMESQRDRFTTNKLGGEADWAQPPSHPSLTSCGLCGASQALVCQIYAPLGKLAVAAISSVLFETALTKVVKK